MWKEFRVVNIGFFLGPIREHFTACENPVDYSLKFWDDDIMEYLTYQSNLCVWPFCGVGA